MEGRLRPSSPSPVVSLFQFNAQPVRDSVHEGKVRNNQSGVQDRALTPASALQSFNVRISAGRGRTGEFCGKIQQHSLRS